MFLKEPANLRDCRTVHHGSYCNYGAKKEKMICNRLISIRDNVISEKLQLYSTISRQRKHFIRKKQYENSSRHSKEQTSIDAIGNCKWAAICVRDTKMSIPREVQSRRILWPLRQGTSFSGGIPCKGYNLSQLQMQRSLQCHVPSEYCLHHTTR